MRMEVRVRLAYADPPYPGRAHLYREHPDYAGEVDHNALIARLQTYDGWALSTSAESLHWLLPLCPEVRVLAWTKHTVAVSWEPVLVRSARPIDHVTGPRDWIAVEPEAFQWRPRPDSYVIGQKPEAFCRWLFQWLGAEHGDTLEDMFPARERSVGHGSDGPNNRLCSRSPQSAPSGASGPRMLAEHPQLDGSAA